MLHLGRVLQDACPPDLWCGIAPFEVVLPGGAVSQPDEPSLVAWRLGFSGSYEQVAHVTGDEPYETTEPVQVKIVPSAVVSDV